MDRSPTLLLLTLAGALAACRSGSSDGGGACTLEVKPAVRVTVTDAGTGKPLHGATAVLTDGAFQETMVEPVVGTYDGARERTGTYDLSITAAGFRPFTATGLVVTHDG